MDKTELLNKLYQIIMLSDKDSLLDDIVKLRNEIIDKGIKEDK